MTSFTVGNARITRLTELSNWQVPIRQWYPQITHEQIAIACERYTPSAVSMDGDQFIYDICNYVVEIGGRVIMIDTCTGNHRDRAALGIPRLHMLDTDYLERIMAAGFDPRRVDTVFNTHLHLDHCGWNTQLVQGQWIPTFPNARYLFHDKELEFITHAWHESGPSGPAVAYPDSIRPILDSAAFEVIPGRHVIAEQGDTKVITLPTPGHTPGHAAIEIIAPGQGVVIIGDAIHHPIQAHFPDLLMFTDNEPAQAARTRAALLAHCADDNLLLASAHIPSALPLRVVRTQGPEAYEILALGL